MGFTPTDIGEYIHTVEGINAGVGTTAGTAVNGHIIDRFAFAKGRYKSVQLAVPFNYVKATATTIAVNVHLQDSASSVSTSTSWADFGSTVVGAGTGTAAVAASTAAVTSHGVYRRNVNIVEARRYLRMRITPQITVVSTVNSLSYNGIMVFGGADEYPAS